jgi:hypothetical protein
MKPEEVKVENGVHPDWPKGSERAPKVGDRVYCAAGLADVVKLLGKHSDGNRIVELKLVDQVAPPFFASTANVLVAPATASLS